MVIDVWKNPFLILKKNLQSLVNKKWFTIFLRAYSYLKIDFFVEFSERKTIQKYVLKMLLRNSKNWLSYS